MIIRRFNFLTRILRRPDDGEGSDLGAPPEVVTNDAPADTGAVVSDVSKPTSMLEAMSNAIAPSGDAGQPRDELGRFAPKAGEPGADPTATPPAVTAPAAPVAAEAQKPVVPVVEDPLAMPEGLTPKAQERFQKLANTNRELAEWREQAEPQLSYIKESFQTNQVKPEQFDMFLQFVGALNRGDLATAQQVIQQEMQAIAQLTGQEFNIDPLAQHPDLLEAVNSFQMTRQAANELARRRFTENAQQQAQQQRQQFEQTQQQAQQAATNAQAQIDQFCRQMQTTDLDYPAVEGQLLQAIKDGLLEGIPPQQWAPLVQRQYQLIKKVATSQRTVPPATPTLRPTGAASPTQAPRSMHEAMFPSR